MRNCAPRLEQQEIDPKKYTLLLLQQKNLQKELQQIGEYQSRQAELETEKQKVFSQIAENRKALSKNRQCFLTRVLQDNPSVSIEVKPFGEAWDNMEKDIRRILQCPDRFDKDIEHLKGVYHDSGAKKIEKRLLQRLTKTLNTPRKKNLKRLLQRFEAERKGLKMPGSPVIYGRCRKSP